MRKSNKPRQRSFKPATKFRQTSQTYARTASIEEVDEDLEEEEEDIPTSATRVAKLDETQHEQWVQEMKNLGINF